MAEERFPIVVRYEGPAKYAKGGLVDAALAVKNAGRYGDTEIIHVNKAELAELTRVWGKPTINPQTGQPEFFLGKLFKKLLPIAAMFIPGVGPAIGSALGVGATAGNALLGAGLGALNGGVGGALTGGVMGAVGPKLFTRGNPAPAGGASTPASVASVAQGAAAQGGPLTQTANAAVQNAVGNASSQSSAQMAGLQQMPTKPNFWNRDFLGLPIKNKFAIPALVTAAALLDKPKGGDAPMPTQADKDKFFDPVFRSNGREPTAGFRDLGRRTGSVDDRVFQAYNAGYLPERANFNYVEGGYAKGGDVHPGGGSPFAVRGNGDGRDDRIAAALSDGEYVMDAETVALLGNGSNRAGAKRLDELRVNLRKHKGKNLSKGKFSLSAKRPEAYMTGGRA